MNFNENENKLGKGWSPGSKTMLGTTTSTLLTLKFELLDHPFIKYYIFEVHVTLSPRGNRIGIISQYYEQHNMSYIFW